MPDGVIVLTEYVATVNVILMLVSMLLNIVVLTVAVQMRSRTRRMGWFITSLCVTMGGLAYQIGSIGDSEYGKAFLISAWFMYSLVAPLFGLYFIETERTAERLESAISDIPVLVKTAIRLSVTTKSPSLSF